MDKLTQTLDDLVIERQGITVTKITKSGVVLWPQERHTAPMQVEGLISRDQLRQLQEAAQKARQQQELERAKGANTRQEGGNHYQQSDATGTCSKCGSTVQHWDWAHNLRGLEYAATKYIARWRDKGRLESLKKAIHYVQKLIEIHFPDVVVTIQYTNRTSVGGGVGQGVGGQQAQGSSGMASGAATHQTAVESEQERYVRLCGESAARVKGDIF